MEFFSLMFNYGVFLDLVFIISVFVVILLIVSLFKGKSLYGYILRFDIVLDIYLKNVLIDMYVKCGLFKYVENIFRKMEYKSLIIWNLMIYGYGFYGDCYRVLSLFDEMKKVGESLDDVMFLFLILVCSYSGFV